MNILDLRKCLFVLFLILIGAKINAQKNGYIRVNDSVVNVNQKLIFDFENPAEVKSVNGKKELIIYNADEITEFGFTDSVRFISKRVFFRDSFRQIFVELIEEGQISIYRLNSGLQSSFIIEDKLMYTLEKDTFKETLSGYISSCNKLQDQLNQVTYTKRSLRDFFGNYNSGNCLNVRFMNYGLSIGYAKSSISLIRESFITSSYWNEDFDLNFSNYSMGAFIEVPVWKIRNTSLIGSLTYFEETFLGSTSSNSSNSDFKFENARLNLNIIPKYTFNTNRVRYYVGLGATMSNTLKFESEVFVARLSSITVRFESAQDIIEPHPYLFGITGLAGIQFFYWKGNYLSIEIANSRMLGKRYSIVENSISIKANL